MNENTINNDVTMDGRASVLASRYRILKQLGQGGMGSVWLAEDTQLDNKLFAIKMLPSILVSNKRAYAQLKSEALVAMKLVHPNIVQIRAFEENNGNPFLVMDYIDGETLDDWLGDRGPELGCRSQELGVSEEEVVKLLKPIAEALDYAHTEGVVHRDIKPANVMIRKDGRPFIMDFGIAREIQETMTRVTGKMSSGTLMYMSPEQLNGDMLKKEQDIYSFAAMVYECLKGEPPFCRGNIEYQIMNKEPEPLVGRVVTNAPNGEQGTCRSTIAPAVMRGLAKKPNDRPKTCVEVLERRDINADMQSCSEKQGGATNSASIRKAECYPDSKFDSVDMLESNETKNFIDNEVSLDDLCYFPTSIRVKEPLNQDGISATKSHDCENARPCEAQNVENLKSEEKVESLSNKTHGFYFGGLIAVLAIVVVAAGSIYKLNGYRQRQQQNEERQKIVAEQKRVAIEARERASLAQGQAKDAGAAAWAAKEWNSALLEKSNAESAWRRADYVNAKCHYLNVGDLFRKSMEVALARKKQEAGSVKPELRVNAVLLGNNVYGAKINDGVRDHITPIRWTLENGKTYGPFKVTYENNGRKYSGKLDAVKVDWLGVREKSVVLTEDVDFSMIDKAENTRKAIEAFNAKRYDESYRLFMKSDLENKEVQFFLGRMYAYGQGVPKNEYEAVKWYRKAAEQGHSSAQNNLGVSYLNGRGVSKDDFEAIRWFSKAAEQGDSFGQYHLGYMYSEGRGVAKDVEKAKLWYRKAADNGFSFAQKALERLENVRVVKPVKYVQPVASQPQQPVLIERPLNLKYCDNCGHALWHRKMIPPRCEKCNAILLKPEDTKKNPTGIDQGTADSIRTWGSIMSGIGGVL